MRHKESLNEYSIERFARVLRLAWNPSRAHVDDPAAVLVDTTRTLGEPFDLHRAPGRRGRLFIRLRDQPAFFAASHRHIAARLGATARIIRREIRTIRGADHGDSSHRGNFLLSRRPVWRAPRSQHPLLEVAAGFGSHRRALEADYSPRDSAVAQFRHQPYNAIH